MYRYRNELEEKNIEYKIVKQKFLNYRQLSFKVMVGKKDLLPAYALSYSTLPRKKTQGKIEYNIDNIHYFNREEIKFITLKNFNEVTKLNYESINSLIFNPPSFEEELKFRNTLSGGNYDLTPIVVLQEIPQTKLTIELNAKTYEDIKEKLHILIKI